jgi:hypothetical protein
MRILLVMAVAIVFAAPAAAQDDGRRNPMDPQAKVPATEFRSAFEGYRPFAEAEPRDWRKSNEDVGKAGGHAGHKPGQGPGQPTSKPQPGKPEASGGHGSHK